MTEQQYELHLSNNQSRIFYEEQRAFSDCLEFKLYGQHMSNDSCQYCNQKNIKNFNYEAQFLYQVPYTGENKVQYESEINVQNQKIQQQKDSKDPSKIFDQLVDNTLNKKTSFNDKQEVRQEETKQQQQQTQQTQQQQQQPKLTKPKRQEDSDDDSLDEENDSNNELIVKLMNKFQDCRCCQGMVFQCRCNDFLDSCTCYMQYKEQKKEKRDQKAAEQLANDLKYKF